MHINTHYLSLPLRRITCCVQATPRLSLLSTSTVSYQNVSYFFVSWTLEWNINTSTQKKKIVRYVTIGLKRKTGFKVGATRTFGKLSVRQTSCLSAKCPGTDRTVPNTHVAMFCRIPSMFAKSSEYSERKMEQPPSVTMRESFIPRVLVRNHF